MCKRWSQDLEVYNSPNHSRILHKSADETQLKYCVRILQRTKDIFLRRFQSNPSFYCRSWNLRGVIALQRRVRGYPELLQEMRVTQDRSTDSRMNGIDLGDAPSSDILEPATDTMGTNISTTRVCEK